MKKRSLNKIKQMVSIGMSCIMAGSTCNLPMMLHAEEVQTENMHPTYMVTSFDELNEEIAYQALSIGAEESEINFPDTLKVKVIRQVEGEPSTEADESVGEGNGAEDSQEGEEWTIEHITWKLDAEKSSLPEFDSSEESAGAVYIYTPNIPETDENGNHYILSEEAILPEIYVMVDCVDNGIVLYSSNIVASGTCGAEGNNGDSLTWILDDEGVLTISGTGAMANWNWKGSPWYANKDKIESVVIEDGVTSIGMYAFGDCSSLASIKLPNSISSIGNAAFSNCSSLTSITISNSVTSIGNSAFYDCSSLTSVIYLGTTEQWNAIKKGRSALSSAQLKNVKCHEHSHALAWSNNATYHWHQCTDEACPVKDEPQAQDGCALHEWENGKCRVCGYICKHTGGTATCTKKAVCTECGIEYGEVDSKNHDILHHAAQAPTCTKNGYEAY